MANKLTQQVAGLPAIVNANTVVLLGSTSLLNASNPASGSVSSIITNPVPGLNPFSSSLSGATNVSSSSGPQDYRVTLGSISNVNDKIIFNVSPSIDESGQVAYTPIDLIHHPGTIQIYKNTGSRLFSINAKFISRTQQEASQTLKWLNLIRSWAKNYFGTGTAKSAASAIGAPPDVLVLNGYGPMNLNQIPVVLTNYGWDWPPDIDYISSTEGFPCPTIFDIKIQLEESYSPSEWEGFDLEQYKAGNMTAAFGSAFSSSPSSNIGNLPTSLVSSNTAAASGSVGDTSSSNLSQQALVNNSIDAGLITSQ